MDLGNMRRQGVHHLIAYCLNDSCRHQALIDVSRHAHRCRTSEARLSVSRTDKILSHIVKRPAFQFSIYTPSTKPRERM
jgi:hypothetical protein